MENSSISDSIHGEIVPDLLYATQNAQYLFDSITDPCRSGLSTFALYGSWGSGKTDLLKRLGRLLAGQGNYVCCFSTWTHELEGDLLLSIISAILDKHNYLFNRKEDLISLDKLDSKEKDKTIKEVLSICESVPNDIIKLIAGIASGVYKLVSHFYKLNDVNKYLPSVSRIHSSITKLVKAIVGSRISEKDECPYLYLLVDDLDRCEPTRIIRFLESLKSIYCINNMRIVMAVDRKPVVMAISAHYESYRADGSDSLDLFCSDYLSKIIDFSYYLPTPLDSRKLFLNALQANPDIVAVSDYLNASTKLDFLESEAAAVNLLLILPKLNNPRLLKRTAHTMLACINELVAHNRNVRNFKFFNSYIFPYLLLVCFKEEGGFTYDTQFYPRTSTPSEVRLVDFLRPFRESNSISAPIVELCREKSLKSLTSEEWDFIEDLCREKHCYIISGFNVKSKSLGEERGQ